MKSRKSQITIFIAVGVILLVLLLVMIYIKSSSVQEREETEIKKAATEIPYNTQVVQQFVSNCAEQTATDAIRKLGEHGGYIDPLDNELSRTIIKLSTEPTESDALMFTPEAKMIIPYWHYMDSKNSCTTACSVSSKKPNLYKAEGEPSIEGQIERYVIKEIPNCINNFTQLKSQGFELVSEGELKASAFVTNENTQIKIDYPVQLKKGSEIIELNEFSANADVNLKKVYDLADELTQQEINETYLERYTLNNIAAFSRLNSKKLPPIAGMDIGCDEVSWTLSDVRDNKIIPMLMSYTPFIQPFGVLNARFYENITNPIQRGLLTQTIINVNISKVAGFKVDYAYLGWPIYFDITPRKGEMLGPEVLGVKTLGICLNQYKFAYDLSYPVMVEIKDPKAFKEQGYTFLFALESNIRNNDPQITDPLQAQLSNESNYYDTNFYCDMNQRLSGNITIKSYDARTNKSLQGVKISYCIPTLKGGCIDECEMGMTNDQGELKTTFPLGQGMIMFSKEDYFDYAGGLYTEYQTEGSYNATLEPFRELKVNLTLKLMTETCNCDISYDSDSNKYNFDSCDDERLNGVPANLKVLETADSCIKDKKCVWQFNPSLTKQPGENDTMIIMLERQPSFSTYQTTLMLGKGSTSNKIKLIPGNYSLSLNYIDGNPRHIPLRKSEGECDNDIQPIDMEQVFMGGIVLDNSTQYWEVTADELDSGSTVNFYAIVPDIKQIDMQQDIGATGQAQKLSSNFTSEIMPRILK